MSSYYDRVKQVVENIENNIENDFDIKSLAKEYSLSPWHFQRLFKGIVGDSLGGYMRGRRLTRGAELLLESELDIIDIAVEVGFGSHEAFTRSFKKQFSQTPKEFRKLSPKVIPNRKPYLNKELQDYIFNGIEREPIIEVREKIILSGYETTIPSPFYAADTMCEGIYPTWMKLLGERNEVIPQNYAGVTLSPSGNYDEENLQFLAAEFVVNPNSKNNERTEVTLPAQKIAKFKIKMDLNSDNLGRTIDYIYGFWLGNSGYIRGDGHDYELFEGVKNFENFDEYSYYYFLPVEEA